MQLKIQIKLEEPCTLPLGYHHIIQSILYEAMKKPEEEESEYHNSGVYFGKRVYRLFTFGLLDGDYQIKGKQITFSDSINLEVRSVKECCLRLAEANLKENGIWLYGTQYKNIKTEFCKKSIDKTGIYINMDSPICVYSTERGETKHTTFFSPYEDRFYEEVNQNFKRKYQAAFGEVPESGIELKLVDVQDKDKYVTCYKNYQITGWKGRYYLSGDQKYLDFLYQVGLGAKNSQGFGMFHVEQPYSYHTFMYPFSYHGQKDSGLPLSDLWEEEFLPQSLKQTENINGQELLLYTEYQYFFPKARTNLFNFSGKEADKATSRHYNLKGLDGKEDTFYVIRRADSEFRLPLKRIRLSLYPEFQIGIMSFEMEYYRGKNRNPFEDVLEINQLGRRLFPPYIIGNESGFYGGSTADEISISGAVEHTIKFHNKQYQFEQRMEFIRNILGIEERENIGLQSILDDRMFVCCLIRDDKISKISFLQDIDGEIEREQAKNVYQFVFVDGMGEYSCQSQRMLERELRTSVYDRWAIYGTFHGVTEYSFVCATGESDEVKNSVINPFLTSYVDMAKLALAQRATIINIENKILDEVASTDSKSGVAQEHLEHIREIWRLYVDFQNKLLLPEVTFQRQGVELYQILKDALKINAMNSHLGEELDHLHDAAELDYQVLERESDEAINKTMNHVAFIGLPLALVSALQDLFFGVKSIGERSGCDIFRSIICWSAPVFIILFWSWLFKKNRKNAKNKFFAFIMIIYIVIIYIMVLICMWY